MNFIPTPPTGTIELLLLTAIITMLMNNLGKEILESLLKIIFRPFNWLSEKIYCYLAPRNPFSIALKSYKKHILRSRLATLENPLNNFSTIPLEQAFAPLKLLSSDLALGVELFNFVAQNQRIMIVGDPGSGKTTLMKSLVINIIKGRCHADLNPLIPVFIELRELASKQQDFKTALVSVFNHYHFPGAENFINSALEQGKLLIICDGLDEVGVNREFVVKQIHEFCDHDAQQKQPNRVLVTCREQAYRTKDLQAVIPEIVKVEPFSNHHMRIFLKGWPEHKGRNAIHLYALLQTEPSIRDICRNPLLLTILTGLYLDNDRFQLPTSRDQFYQNALDELLNQRPSRRSQKQDFNHYDKCKILERVALAHLESINIDQDTEEFSFEAIKQKATEVLPNDKFDCRAFIKELIQVNGILKETKDDHYTLAHRSIQEYLAAHEAGRTRTAEQVVKHFGEREDLIEVLYFYCGQLNNIPQLTCIVQSFVDKQRWQQAGRCLLNATDALDAVLISEVSTGLYNKIIDNSTSDQALMLLASLAQRNDVAFTKTRELFGLAIDFLAEQQEHGAASLESTLAASPELAMNIIPSLLQHPSTRWQQAAVQLLRDIGTDAGLDKLVGLLQHQKAQTRTDAAWYLASMIGTHNAELKERAVLLPERRDITIWPLQDYFPSRLAIPMAEIIASANWSQSGIKAMTCAAEAILNRTLPSFRADKTRQRHWRNLRRDLKISHVCRKVAAGIHQLALVFIVSVVLGLAGLTLFSATNNKLIIFDTKNQQIHQIDDVWFKNVTKHYYPLINLIEDSYPANASGFARILPWNWGTEPVLPSEEQNQAFEKLLSWHYKFFNITDQEIANDFQSLASLSELNILVKANYIEFQQAVVQLQDHLPNIPPDFYLSVTKSWGVWIGIFMFLLSMSFKIYVEYVVENEVSEKNIKIIFNKPLFSYLFSNSFFSVSTFAVFFALIPSTILNGSFLKFLPTTLFFTLQLLAWLLTKLPWANNPLINTVDDFIDTTSR